MKQGLLGLAIVLLVGFVQADESPKLSFAQNGDDLIITADILINNSQHVAATKATRVGDKVHLEAWVVQNRNWLVRSQRRLKLEWRLADTKKDGLEFVPRVSKRLIIATDLKGLQAELDRLVEAEPKK